MSSTSRILADMLEEMYETEGVGAGALSHIFKEEPPNLDTWLYDSKYLNHMRPTLPTPDLNGYKFTLSPIQYDFVRNFEQIFYPELYIEMVREFGEYWAPKPMKNMFALEWGKGSRSPDSKIYNADTGEWVPLRSFEGGTVASAHCEDGIVSRHLGTKSFKEGEGNMFRVHTASGRTSDVWEGHRFLSNPDSPSWGRLWDLEEGSEIAISTHLPAPVQCAPLPDDLVVWWSEMFYIYASSAESPYMPLEIYAAPYSQIMSIIGRLLEIMEEQPLRVKNYNFAVALQRLALRVDIVLDIHRAHKDSWEVSRNIKYNNRHGDLMWDEIIAIEPLGRGEYWTLSVDGPASYISEGGVLDHNSGKDTVVRIGVVRIASLLQYMHSPQGYFNMSSNDAITILNVAATAQQARDAFFDPLKRLYQSNEYLSSHFKGDTPSEGASRLRLNNNVFIQSGNSLAENQEGHNLIAACADEISAFKIVSETNQKGDGRAARTSKQIVDMLRTSSSSRFPKTYKVAQISFPRFRGDAIEQAIAEGQKSIKKFGYTNSIWYTSGPHATWDIRPGITKESFAEFYEADPVQADMMYGCKPPLSTNTFIRNLAAIEEAFSTVKEEPITVDYYFGPLPDKSGISIPTGVESPDSWQVEFTFSEDLVPKEGALYCLHGDLAITGDRAGIAMSHVKSYLENTDGDERPIVENDFVFTFESDLGMDPPREVQIRWYRQLVWELIDRGFEIHTVTFDGFQSQDIIQSLASWGIDTGLLSLDRNDKVYQSVKDIILDARLKSYRTDISEEPLAMQELSRLRRTGKKVDHLPSFSKDASDALAGSVYNAVAAGGEEDTEELSTMFYTSDAPDEIQGAMSSGFYSGGSMFPPNISPSFGMSDSAPRSPYDARAASWSPR